MVDPPAPRRLLEVQAAVDETVERLERAKAEGERVQFALAGAAARREEAQVRADAALAMLHESDARLAAVAERLGQLGSDAALGHG